MSWCVRQAFASEVLSNASRAEQTGSIAVVRNYEAETVSEKRLYVLPKSQALRCAASTEMRLASYVGVRRMVHADGFPQPTHERLPCLSVVLVREGGSFFLGPWRQRLWRGTRADRCSPPCPKSRVLRICRLLPRICLRARLIRGAPGDHRVSHLGECARYQNFEFLIVWPSAAPRRALSPRTLSRGFVVAGVLSLGRRRGNFRTSPKLPEHGWTLMWKHY
jgi:hypothetical protein